MVQVAWPRVAKPTKGKRPCKTPYGLRRRPQLGLHHGLLGIWREEIRAFHTVSRATPVFYLSPRRQDAKNAKLLAVDREEDGRWIAEALEAPGVMSYARTLAGHWRRPRAANMITDTDLL